MGHNWNIFKSRKEHNFRTSNSKNYRSISMISGHVKSPGTLLFVQPFAKAYIHENMKVAC